MINKIILMRHGRPMVDLNSYKSQKMSTDDLGKIVRDYVTVDLDLKQKPPPESLKIAMTSNVVLSSDMPRAVSSVKMLNCADKAKAYSELKENDMPYLNWQRPKLSFFTWCIIFRICWLFGFSKNGESIKIAQQRADIGAKKLHNLALENGTALLLGHGIMNRLIAKKLKNRGWKNTSSNGIDYWSYSVFELNQ